MTTVPMAVVERAYDLIEVLEAEESLDAVSRMKLAFGTIDPQQASALVTKWRLAVSPQAGHQPPRVTARDLLAKRPRGLALVKVPKRG